MNELSSTKRSVVSSVSSIFDPLGFLAPLLLEPKLFMRKLCQPKLTWDEPFNEDLRKEWHALSSQFNYSMSKQKLEVPRRVADQCDPVTLVVFTDASTKAYGFVIYAVQKGVSRFLFSKFKLAPQSAKTLSSLELLALYLSLHCIDTYISDVNNHLNITNINFLTDSQIALSWILKGKDVKKNVFVSNRIKNIEDFKESLSKRDISFNFSHVPSEHNIADILTKPIPIGNFISDFSTWANGPSWITLDKHKWSKGQLGCLPSPFINKENVTSLSHPVISNIVEEVALVSFDRFSSYSKLLLCVIKFFEAIQRFKREAIDNLNGKRTAFHYLIKQIQRHCFVEEICFLLKVTTKSGRVPKLISNLNLFLDKHGVLRSGSHK